MVRVESTRSIAVQAAFALGRMYSRVGHAERALIRTEIEDRRNQAVGHDRAALSALMRRLIDSAD